mgnify:CR=1 FL=1
MNKALKNLINMGQTTAEVTVYGSKWKMHTLDSQDQLVATNSTSAFDDLSRVLAMKIAILSRAIDSVDGEPLGNAGEAREALSKLQASLIHKLYDEYDKLIEQQNTKLKQLEEKDDKTADSMEVK